MGLFSTKTSTYDPMSAYTSEQQTAIKALMNLAATGTGGGITLGQGYSGDLGYYTQNAGELESLANLQSLYDGSELNTAKDVYSRMANNKFNPDDPSSGYASFSKALAKAGKESDDILNRESAITGSRYGTAILGSKADLSADLANQRGMFLSDLYNQSENRALQGAQGMQSLVGTQQNLLSQIADYSAMERELKNQQAQDQYSEWQRSRSEELSRVGLMQEQWQNPMGTITQKSPSTAMKMIGEAVPVVGSYNTQKYGYTTNQTSISDAIKALTQIASGGGF